MRCRHCCRPGCDWGRATSVDIDCQERLLERTAAGRRSVCAGRSVEWGWSFGWRAVADKSPGDAATVEGRASGFLWRRRPVELDEQPTVGAVDGSGIADGPSSDLLAACLSDRR